MFLRRIQKFRQSKAIFPHSGGVTVYLNNQTYKNFKVLLSDDSPDGRVTLLLRSEPFKPLLEPMDVTIMEGPREGAYKNMTHLLQVWDGATDLFHVLLDDDGIYPKFYEYHVGVHSSPGVVCSISRRWTAQVAGLPVTMLFPPSEVESNMARAFVIDPNLLFKTVVPHCNNWLGELSNTVMNKELASLSLLREMNGIPFMGMQDLGIGDIAFFLQASTTHNVVFIQDYLGFFRVNPHQHTAQLQSHGLKEALLGWVPIAIASMQMNRVSRQEAFSAIKRIEAAVRHSYPKDEEMNKFANLFAGYSDLTDELVERFCVLWRAFLA
jgi:hypothetical protein